MILIGEVVVLCMNSDLGHLVHSHGYHICFPWARVYLGQQYCKLLRLGIQTADLCLSTLYRKRR